MSEYQPIKKTDNIPYIQEKECVKLNHPMKRLLFPLILFFLFCDLIQAQQVNDPKLVGWAQLYLDGDSDALNRALLEEIQTNGEHSFYAGYVWCLIFQDASVIASNHQLQRSCTLRQFRNKRDYTGMMRAFPLDEVQHWDNFWDVRSYYWGLNNGGRYAEHRLLLLNLLKNGSNDFNVAWSIVDVMRESELFRLEVVDLLLDSSCCDERLGTFLKKVAQYSDIGNHHTLEAFLEIFGDESVDYEQLRFMADYLASIQRYEESASTWKKVTSIDPYGTALQSAALNIYRAGNQSEALELILQRSIAHANVRGIEFSDVHAQFTSQLFRSVGEWGKAREALTDRIEAKSTHPEIWLELARIEFQSGRFPQAIDASRKAFELNQNVTHLSLWLESMLENGDAADVWETFSLYRDDISLLNERIYWIAGTALERLEAQDVAIEVYQDALKHMPDSGWMLRMLGNAYRITGSPQQGLPYLRRAIRVDSNNLWTFFRLADTYRELYRGDASDRYRKEILADFESLEHAWRGYAQLRPFDSIAIYEEARLTLQNHYWPVGRLAHELRVTNAPFAYQYELFEDNLDRFDEWHTDARIDYLNNFFDTIFNEARQVSLSSEKLEIAAGLLEEFLALGGTSDTYHYGYYRLYEIAGMHREAIHHLLQALDANPDNLTYITSMFTDFVLRTNRNDAFIRYHRYVERNPWDGSRVASLAHRHLRWGGSALVALNYYERLKHISPDKLNLSEYNSALQTLGNRAAAYRNTWLNNLWGPARSDRYISWYENARLNAQRESLDFSLNDDGSIDIFHPNGMIATYKDDPITGRPVFIRFGAAFMEAEYDGRGNLLLLSASSGASFRFGYNSMDKITEFTIIERGSDVETWYVAYDDNEQIISVSDKDRHTLTITRNNSGDILDSEASGGSATITKVNEVFTRMQTLARALDGQRYGELPNLPYTDETRDDLADRWYESEGSEEASAGLAYVDYLLKHLRSHPSHLRETESVLRYMSEPGNVTMTDAQQLQLVTYWHTFLSETRPLGVDQTDWNFWQQQLDWLSKQTFRRQLAREADALRQKIDTHPIVLLPSARWVPESAYMNPALWKANNIYELGHQHGISLKVNTALKRQNGDMLVGTSHGLAVNRKGYWELLVFDDVRGNFSQRAVPTNQGNATSHITALAEDDSEMLWIGTQNGLVRLSDSYTERPKRWRTESDGLPHPGIRALLSVEETLFVGTSGGLVAVNLREEHLRIVSTLGVSELNPFKHHYGEFTATVVTRDGIYLLQDDELVKIHNASNVRSAIISPDSNEVFFIEGNILYRKPIDGSLTEKYPISGQQDIIKTTDIQKLRYLPVPNERATDAIAVLTDQGITAYHQSNFEFLQLSELLTDRRVQVDDIISDGGDLYLILDNRMLTFSPNQHRVIPGIKALDMIYAEAWDYTFIATGNRLLYSSSNNIIPDPEVFDYINASNLALTQGGGLIATNRSHVVYYAPGSINRQLLFTSEGLAFLEGRTGVSTPESFNSLLVASDGSIWATTPTTLFRYVAPFSLEDGATGDEMAELFVYSFYLDPDEFPSYSDMLSRVIETKDGDIWVVASDEGHRYINGVQLNGGLLRFNGEGFDNLKNEMGFDWFITSYTQIDEETAFAGTTRGFALHQGSRYRQLWSLEDASYLRLRSEMPMLWLGTQGAKFGEDTFLFGTAGGVVLYNNGEWYYPQNLNRLLPDDIRFGERGARHIHSVATNKSGTIFVSTDRGLLIYDLGDNDDALLFQQNGMYEQALRQQQRLQLIREADVLMDALSANPDLSRLINEIKREQNEIDHLQDKIQGNEKLGRNRSAPSSTDSRRENDVQGQPINLTQQLEDRRRNYEALTRLLEMEHHGAFQMLQLNPLDVAQLRHQLGEKERIAVYIPTRNKLTIQLIDRDEIRLIEVDITAEKLNRMSTFVADHLAGRNFENRRTFGSSAIAAPDRNSEERNELVNSYLIELYEYLLRPVEAFISSDELLYIVPTGSLNYLPYSALIRGVTPRVEYAVQRFTIGILPSMYLLDLVLRHQPSTSRNAMIIGDPDGSLPGARQEAQDIHGILRPASPLLLGSAADINAILRYASDARIVHFATHGKLDPEDPARSFLLLANNQQLGVVDVMQLPLKNTDLVVLSACETGLGTTGLEYATLARAFAHAGAPSILATLWEVPDEPSKLLVTQFYRNIQAGANVFKALSDAQRKMIQEHPGLQHPVNWAGYVPFGKP